MTHEKLFHAPVPLTVGLGFKREIGSVAEAQNFLADWYPSRRGPLYEAAVKACDFAAQDYVTTYQARWAFMNFAEATGILWPDVNHSIAARAVTRSSYGGFAS